jgi:hypothetical protein
MTICMTLFDVDGTIWDAPIDWLAVRCELGLPVDGRLIYMHLNFTGRLAQQEVRT